MNQSSHYLLTGASGYLGRLIKEHLLANHFKVTGLDLSEQPLNVDITRPFNLDKDLDPDVIIHAAGKVHSVPKTAREAQAFYNVNFEGTKNLCAALDNLPVRPKAFIFVSTVAVYGLDSGNMITENHPLQGTSPYAKSKILAEAWLTEWATRNKIKLTILRLPVVAGPNPPGNLGAMINGICSGYYLSIGKADAQKSIVWYEDIASLIPVVAETGGIYNLTDKEHPSFKQLEQVIAKKLGKKIPIAIPMFLARTLALVGNLFGPHFPFNSSKLKKMTSTLIFDDRKASITLGWKPSSVLEKLSTV